MKKSYSTKDYIFPSGKVIQIQGYEHFALDLLLKEYHEADISIGRDIMPEFWYYNQNKYRRYFLDIYIKKENLIIEVKSTWTYKINRNKIILKAKTVKYNGYKFMLLVFDKDGTIVFKTILS